MSLPRCKRCDTETISKSEKQIADKGISIQILQCPNCDLFDLAIYAPANSEFALHGLEGASSKSTTANEIALILLKRM